MKKSARFVVLLLFIFGMTFFAPNAVWGQGVGGGLTGGVVTSQIDGDTWGGYNKWGYQIGGFAYYDFTENISMQIEILHTHRGSREVVNDFGKVNLNYIDVPVLFQYKKDAGNGLLTAEGGLSANILLSARTGFAPLQADRTEDYRRLSTELHIGSCYYFGERVGLFGRWSVGLSNLNATEVVRPWLTIHYITAGLRLKLQ